MISAFHFLRPWWLVAIVPAALLWTALRRSGSGQARWRSIVAPHLLPYLLVESRSQSKWNPADLAAVGWVLSIIAVAGPAWRQEPTPFADDVAALAVVVRVTPSMMTDDVQPSRLARSVEKIEDLLKLRRGAKTSLVAYSGTAHIVMPTTTDDGVIKTCAQALAPAIMPREGDAPADALRLADETLADAGGGSILWIADGVAPEQQSALAAWRRKSETPVRLLAPLRAGDELTSVETAAQVVNASSIHLAADDADVQQVAHAARFAPALGGDKLTHWQEAGYWLTPAIVLLTLLFFRRGWMAPASAA
ncbi:MAG: VWA domain-containing protein [Pirellulales bacterium]|nr:VWA domain-containing protein [Pirellulales bacterium]